MRLILPTGKDGAERSYPLDDILNRDQITLNEMIELRRVTGMDIPAVWRGLAMLDEVLGVPNTALLDALSEHLELMRAYRALVWLARNRAGDRGADGSVLTVEAAVDFPFAGLDVRPDPGDEVDADGGGDVSPDPRKAAPAGGRAAGNGKRKTPASRASGRRKTSAGKS